MLLREGHIPDYAVCEIVKEKYFLRRNGKLISENRML